jgi:hypothetical protein
MQELAGWSGAAAPASAQQGHPVDSSKRNKKQQHQCLVLVTHQKPIQELAVNAASAQLGHPQGRDRRIKIGPAMVGCGYACCVLQVNTTVVGTI